MDRLAESIGYLLDDLAIDGCTFRPTGEEFGSTGNEVSADFVNTCSLLLAALGTYNSGVKSMDHSTVDDIYEGFAALHPPFKLAQVRESARPELLQYRILHFLCTTLQSERLHKHASKSGARFESAGKYIHYIYIYIPIF